jgi:hypothetical protein
MEQGRSRVAQTTSGEWVHLPGVGTSSQGLVNTLRAWIKSTSAGSRGDEDV